MAPHVTDKIKPENIFDFEKLKQEAEMTPEEEMQRFELEFASAEDRQKLQSKIITEKLKEINANKENKELESNGNRS